MQKITNYEYVDLPDLLPDQLLSNSTSSTDTVVVLPESAYATHRKKKRQIGDIATWVQVYSTYMLVLGSSSPHLLPDLIAYQLLIVQHSKKFEYPSWLRYDVDFRQWAAANNCHTWSQIHPQFYAFAFTAQGKAFGWCPICYSDGSSHTYDCPRFSAPHTFPTHLPTPRTNFRPYPAPPLPPPPAWQSPEKSGLPRPPPPKRPSPEHYILYNKYHGNCPYGDRCTKTHMCAHCRRPGHPVSRCFSKPTTFQ